MDTKVSKLKQQMSGQESVRVAIEQNLAYRQVCNELRNLEGEIARVEEKMQEHTSRGDPHELKEQLERERANELKHKHQGEGETTEIQKRVHEIEAHLQMDKYRNIDKKHRQKLIEEVRSEEEAQRNAAQPARSRPTHLFRQETTGLALKDLEKYQSALDRALMRFHAIKIAEINKIINDLWQLIYRGEVRSVPRSFSSAPSQPNPPRSSS